MQFPLFCPAPHLQNAHVNKCKFASQANSSFKWIQFRLIKLEWDLCVYSQEEWRNQGLGNRNRIHLHTCWDIFWWQCLWWSRRCWGWWWWQWGQNEMIRMTKTWPLINEKKGLLKLSLPSMRRHWKIWFGPIRSSLSYHETQAEPSSISICVRPMKEQQVEKKAARWVLIILISGRVLMTITMMIMMTTRVGTSCRYAVQDTHPRTLQLPGTGKMTRSMPATRWQWWQLESNKIILATMTITMTIWPLMMMVLVTPGRRDRRRSL